MDTSIQTLVYVAGLAQIVLASGSLLIPRILNWSVELKKVPTLIKQMFWTYAAYILVLNLCFGLLSVFAAKELLNHSVLAIALSGFIAIYWISRLLIQFLYFDRKSFPAGRRNRMGEIILVALFVFLSGVYALVFYYNSTDFIWN